MEDVELIKRCVYHTPLALTSLPEHLKVKVNELIPYDTGIEVECSNRGIIPDKMEVFSAIPELKALDLNSYEQRFRLPSGIDGLICLYKISLLLKDKFGLNPLSGIHYHTDLNDLDPDTVKEFFHKREDSRFLELEETLLTELDSWDYKGKYNKRGLGYSSKSNWVTFNSIGTLEVRTGEMTFDYEVLVKRVLHCQYLNKIFRSYISCETLSLKFLNEKLKKLKEQINTDLDLHEVKQIISNRIIKI